MTTQNQLSKTCFLKIMIIGLSVVNYLRCDLYVSMYTEDPRLSIDLALKGHELQFEEIPKFKYNPKPQPIEQEDIDQKPGTNSMPVEVQQETQSEHSDTTVIVNEERMRQKDVHSTSEPSNLKGSREPIQKKKEEYNADYFKKEYEALKIPFKMIKADIGLEQKDTLENVFNPEERITSLLNKISILDDTMSINVTPYEHSIVEQPLNVNAEEAEIYFFKDNILISFDENNFVVRGYLLIGQHQLPVILIVTDKLNLVENNSSGECEQIMFDLVHLVKFNVSFITSSKSYVPLNVQDQKVYISLKECTEALSYEGINFTNVKHYLSFAGFAQNHDRLMESLTFPWEDQLIIGGLETENNLFSPMISYEANELNSELKDDIAKLSNEGILKSSFTAYFTKKNKFEGWGGIDSLIDEQTSASVDFMNAYVVNFEIRYLNEVDREVYGPTIEIMNTEQNIDPELIANNIFGERKGGEDPNMLKEKYLLVLEEFRDKALNLFP